MKTILALLLSCLPAAAQQTFAKLAWDPSPAIEQVTHYTLYLGPEPGTWTATFQASHTVVELDGAPSIQLSIPVVAGETYSAAVSATNLGGESLLSAPITFEAPLTQLRPSLVTGLRITGFEVVAPEPDPDPDPTGESTHWRLQAAGTKPFQLFWLSFEDADGRVEPAETTSSGATLGPDENATDLDDATRWYHEDPAAWIAVRFAAPVTVRTVILRTGVSSRAPELVHLQTSADGILWETVHSFPVPSGSIQTIALP